MLALSLLLTILAAAVSGCGSADASDAYPTVDLDGKSATLSDYQGKPLFLVFMTST